MTMRRFDTYRSRPARRLCAALLLCLVLPTNAAAFRLLGHVVNGTSGEPVADVTVKIVNPSGGMAVEKEARTSDNGHFEADGLAENVPVHLLRVMYRGVNYTETVRFDGRDPVRVQVHVYERTDSWDGVTISVPHMMISRSLDTLTVEKFVQVSNASSPPKTVYADSKRLPIFLPPDAIEINAVTVRSLGVPLPVTPLPSGEAGMYSIDYPIRPGLTSVQASFDLPYKNSEYVYAEPLKHDLSELLVITQDPSMQVTSRTAEVSQEEDFHGFTSYKLTGLAAGDTLSLLFRGGKSAPASARTGTQVLIVANPTRDLGIGVMIALLTGLCIFLVNVTARGHSSRVEKEVLAVQKEELLDQLARLDDLHKTDTVSDLMYRMKRAELITALAGIYYRTSYKKADSQKAKGKGAVRV